MITSTRKDKVTPKKNKYPCLMIGLAGSMVIMLSDDGEFGRGTLVQSPTSVGHRELYLSTNGWPIKDFKPYDGKIILENK